MTRRFMIYRNATIAAALLLLGYGAYWFIATQEFVSWDLQHGLWSSSYLLVRGLNPYGWGAPGQVVRAVWLPMAVGLFYPLGWLTAAQASSVWLLGNVVILILIVWLAGGVERPVPWLLASCLLLVFLFPSVLSSLRLGQFSLLIVVLFLVATHLMANRMVTASSLLIAAALTKPQLALLAIPGFLIWSYRTGGIRSVFLLMGGIALSIVWLTIPLWIVYPAWIVDFWQITLETPTWLQPSLFRVLQVQFGVGGLVIWSLLVTGLLGIDVWLWSRLQPREAIVWSLALTTLATPYLWSWDFVLLIPLLVYALYHYGTHFSKILLVLGSFGIWAVMIWIRITTENSDERFWWVPLATMAVIGLGYLAAFYSAKRSGIVALGRES